MAKVETYFSMSLLAAVFGALWMVGLSVMVSPHQLLKLRQPASVQLLVK